MVKLLLEDDKPLLEKLVKLVNQPLKKKNLVELPGDSWDFFFGASYPLPSDPCLETAGRLFRAVFRDSDGLRIPFNKASRLFPATTPCQFWWDFLTSSYPKWVRSREQPLLKKGYNRSYS